MNEKAKGNGTMAHTRTVVDKDRGTTVLLMNLGTPDAPEPEAVARYLREFLMDPLVIDVPKALRWIFVHMLIVPKRKHTSAEAYKKVWTHHGSPLLAHCRDLAEGVSEQLGLEFDVVLAMRYGAPSIKNVIRRAVESHCKRLILLPLYPQFADSSTGSSLEECRKWIRESGFGGEVVEIPPFYEHPAFLDSYAEIISSEMTARSPDHILFSYHGLPERHIARLDRTGAHCLKKTDCCSRIEDSNTKCYRAQCYATTRGLVTRLGLEPGRHSVSFQSRLGRTPWIRPFTDEVCKLLPAQGVRRLMVVCPSFTADCLETLEEIAMRARDEFKAAGGDELTLVPCLNSHPTWVRAVTDMVRSVDLHPDKTYKTDGVFTQGL